MPVLVRHYLLKHYIGVVGDQPKFKQRTDWAEYCIEQLAAQPLISECVYRSPQRTDTTQKEVIDVLLVLSGRALLLSLKCQERPGSRSVESASRWTVKAAKGAASQINGALRSLRSIPCWCDHPRRGKVQFEAGELKPIHGLVLVETLNPVILPSDLPLYKNGIPITYMSVNDFCFIIRELRTIPEIEAYLNARCALPLDALRLLGKEGALYGYYLLHEEAFTGCLGHDDAHIVLNARSDELHEALSRKSEADKYARLIEKVADCLAERNPQYKDGLNPEDQTHFDSTNSRRNYLLLQQELCNLRLAGRAGLGRHFAELIDKVERAEKPAMVFASVRYDGKPDFVYVLVSTRGEPRAELIERTRDLLFGAMAFYDKRRGMAIVDRDSVGFEVMMFDVPCHSITAFHVGEYHFGKLRTSHIPATLVPSVNGTGWD